MTTSLVNRSFYISPETDRKLRHIAFTRGCALGDLLREYVENGIEAEPPTIAEKVRERIVEHERKGRPFTK